MQGPGWDPISPVDEQCLNAVVQGRSFYGVAACSQGSGSLSVQQPEASIGVKVGATCSLHRLSPTEVSYKLNVIWMDYSNAHVLRTNPDPTQMKSRI